MSVRRLIAIIIALLGLVVILSAAPLLTFDRNGRSPDQVARGLTAGVDPKTYQAVFLTDRRVFFGKLTRVDGALALSDIYYVTQPTTSEPAGRLIKRGSEIHGPPSPMVIAPAQVLFVENVGAKSEVAQGIKRIKEGATTVTPSSSP